MLSGARLVDIIGSRLDTLEDPVVVYWYSMEDGDRASFAKEVEDSRGPHRIVPLIPRGAMQFVNANALQSDLAALLDASRAEITRCPVNDESTNGRLAIVLLMRQPMTIAQISSPAVLPDWFPVFAGQSVHVRFEDLTRSAELPLSAVEAKIQLLPRRLYELDLAMVVRLRAVLLIKQHDVSAFFADIRQGPKESRSSKETKESTVVEKDPTAPNEDRLEKVGPFLDGAAESLRTVPNPDDYRPSVKDARTLVPRLQALVARTPPDQMSVRARLLATALGVEMTDNETSESLIALLVRPTQLDTNPAIRFGRSLLWSSYAAMQLVTAAKHADAYRAFPVLLASSTVRDLALTLEAIADTIRRAQ